MAWKLELLTSWLMAWIMLLKLLNGNFVILWGPVLYWGQKVKIRQEKGKETRNGIRKEVGAILSPRRCRVGSTTTWEGDGICCWNWKDGSILCFCFSTKNTRSAGLHFCPSNPSKDKSSLETRAYGHTGWQLAKEETL
jgi:hypothetical protein